MKLIISSVHKKYFEGEVKSATCPGSAGVFTLLSNHSPFITTLKKGSIKVVKEDNSEEMIDVSDGGLVEVSKNEAVILV